MNIRSKALNMRIIAVLAALLVMAVFASSAVAQSKLFPPVVPLPDGFNGEGVVVGYGPVIYAGSLADGSIYEANLLTGDGEILIEGQEGDVTVGLSFDRETGYLFAAGGPTGVGRVYDTNTGDLLAEYPMASGGDSGDFVNDVIVTEQAAYFTNSFAPEIYRLPLGPDGSLPDGDADVIALGGDWEQVEGFNANGIEASSDGQHLLIVNSGAETLYRIDPESGIAETVDLGDYPLTNGDGLVLSSQSLYVVQNRLNQIAEFSMDEDLLGGDFEEVITDNEFRVPTTADRLGPFLYAVNARFGQDTDSDPTFEIIQVRH